MGQIWSSDNGRNPTVVVEDDSIVPPPAAAGTANSCPRHQLDLGVPTTGNVETSALVQCATGSRAPASLFVACASHVLVLGLTTADDTPDFGTAVENRNFPTGYCYISHWRSRPPLRSHPCLPCCMDVIDTNWPGTFAAFEVTITMERLRWCGKAAVCKLGPNSEQNSGGRMIHAQLQASNSKSIDSLR